MPQGGRWHRASHSYSLAYRRRYGRSYSNGQGSTALVIYWNWSLVELRSFNADRALFRKSKISSRDVHIPRSCINFVCREQQRYCWTRRSIPRQPSVSIVLVRHRVYVRHRASRPRLDVIFRLPTGGPSTIMLGLLRGFSLPARGSCDHHDFVSEFAP